MSHSLVVDAVAVATGCDSRLPVHVYGELLSSSTQSCLHSASRGSSSEGVPSVVLSRSLAALSNCDKKEGCRGILSSSVHEFFGVDNDGGEGDAKREVHWQYCNGRDLDSQQMVSHSTKAIPNGRQSSSSEIGLSDGQISPRGMRYCPRSPSAAAGRREEPMEDPVGPGSFSPGGACSLSVVGDAVGDDKTAGEYITLPKNMDGTHEEEDGDRTQAVYDLVKIGEKWGGTRGTGSARLSLEDGRLFSNCTNENSMCGSRKALHVPVGINTSHPNQEQQEGRCQIHHRRDKQPGVMPSQDYFPPTDQPPVSFISTGEKSAIKDRSRSVFDENAHKGGRRHWILGDGLGYRGGETKETPVLLSAILDRDWGAMCEEELASWRRRCILAEQQLASATQCIREYCASTSTAMTSSSSPQPPRSVSLAQERETLGGSSVTNELLLESKRLQKMLLDTAAVRRNKAAEAHENTRVRANDEEMYHTGALRHKKNYVDATTSTAEDTTKWVREEEFQRLQDTTTRLRLECDALRSELSTEALRYADLEKALLAMEERHLAQREEWLVQEKEMTSRKEELDTLLHEAQLNATNAVKQVTSLEKDLEAVQTQCRVMETELAAARVEVHMLRAVNGEAFEEVKCQQMQLQPRKMKFQLCNNTNKDKEEHRSETDDKIINGVVTKLSGAMCKRAERQLRRVLVAVEQGDTCGEWIISQLAQIMRTVKMSLTHETGKSPQDYDDADDDADVDDDGGTCTATTMLYQLVRSLEALVEAGEEALRNEWEKPDLLSQERWDKSPILAQHGIRLADLIARGQKCVSRLLVCVDAVQISHVELMEELKVVRADRNELVGQQSKFMRHFQQQLLAAERERVHLTSSVMERDERIRDLEEKSSSDGKPTANMHHLSPWTIENVTFLQAVHMRELGWLEEKMQEQVDEFARSLLASFVEVMEAVAQVQKERLSVLEERASASQSQLQRLREERELNQQLQEESLNALRGQLSNARAELVSKEESLRIALNTQLRQNSKRCQHSFTDRASQAPDHLNSCSTTSDLISTPPPSSLRPAVEEGGINSDNNTTFMESLNEGLDSVTPVREVSLAPFQCSESKNDAMQRTVKFAPSVLIAEQEKDQKQQQLKHKQQRFPKWCNPVSPSSSSSYSSTSSPKVVTADQFTCTYAVQRGVMRKHREVWMRQAEQMGIPSDME